MKYKVEYLIHHQSYKDVAHCEKEIIARNVKDVLTKIDRENDFDPLRWAEVIQVIKVED